MNPWIIWFLVGLAFLVSEFFLPGVVLVFFGLAAWVVAALASIGLIESLALQLICFAGVSLAFTGSLRRLILMRLDGGKAALPGASDEFVGKSAVILTDFEKPGDMGKVEFKGVKWKARAEEELRPGDAAEIAAVEGITLVVRRRWIH